MIRRSFARSTPASALLMIALLSATSSRPVSAQSAADVDAARALFVEGATRGQLGRWEEARQLFARSLELKPSPMTRYSLGVAQKETGHFADALCSFRAFLAAHQTPATASYTGPARTAVTELERHVGRVTIAVEPHPPAGLTLTIDGQPVPQTTAEPREIDPGTHEVVARAPGHDESVARFAVAAGRSAAVAIPLRPSAPKPPSRTIPFVLLGTGGVLVTSGMAVGLFGVGQASGASTRDGSDASAARTKGVVGDVLGGVGLAAAGVGLVLLLTQGGSLPTTVGAMTPWMSGSCAGIQLSL